MNPSPDQAQERQEELNLPVRHRVVAILVVAAVYAYFLIFAQFGFLRALNAALGETHPWLRPLLAIMAVAGIAGGIGCCRCYTEKRGPHLLRLGFALAALAAGITWWVRGPLGFSVAALAAGAGLGFATVALATLLRREIGGARLGSCIGWGTGLAYALASLPQVFHAAPSGQALCGIIAAGAGLIATQFLEQKVPRRPAEGFDYQPRVMALWIGVFLLLVGSDSAVFYVIQHQPGLQAAWPAGASMYLNAGVHWLAAVLAGLALDRRWITSTVLAGAGLLAGASLWFAGGSPPVLAGYLYSAGVSIYSVTLVFYPARRGRPGLAAMLYAVAGWGGSALGIGLAEKLDHVPWWLPVTGLTLIAGLLRLRASQK